MLTGAQSLATRFRPDYGVIKSWDRFKHKSGPVRADAGENNYFLLNHSVGAKPLNSEIDVPLVYADYYYLEALLRHDALQKKQPLRF